MPLLSHFVPPLVQSRPWEGFHSTWATMLAQQLNRILPPGYVAIPQTSRGPHVEIDVAALAVSQAAATSAWAPGEPAWREPVTWSDRDLFEVRVTLTGDTPRLVGAIELVSPANKDRPAACWTFAGKCAGYLRNQVGLIVVDVVTVRHHDLHRELLDLLELDVPPDAWHSADCPLYAVPYRTSSSNDARLELWPRRLDVGAVLPTLPFWIAPDLPVSAELEASYADACATLRMS